MSISWLKSIDLRFFWRIFLPLGLLVTGGTVVTFLTDVNGRIAQAASEERSRLERRAAVIGFRLKDLVSDLQLVAHSVHLDRDLGALGQERLTSLQQELKTFIASKNVYDQARYLDASGMERVRVGRDGEGRARVVADQDLQNKAKRYYFSDTITLDAAEVYISPFDLNVERDQIEVPHKPMIRLATPLFTADGQRSGVAVLNYLGNDLLKRLDEGAHSTRAPVQLLNRDGHWLKGPDPAREWGFMYQRQDSFATDHPRPWAALQLSAEGQMEERGRLWTWRRIDLLPQGARSSAGTAQAQGGSEAPLDAQDYHWFVVSEIGAKLQSGQYRELVVRHGILWAFAMGFVAFTSGWIALRQGQLNQRNRQLAQSARELEFLATHDPLTDVLNRRAFFERADIECARAQRSSRPIAVLCCDLDFFKRINDTHGHQTGDRVLKDFCTRVKGMLRTADIMARFGGEEFVLLLPDTGLAGAQHLAERLRREIETPRDPSLPGYTVSIGVAAWAGPAEALINIQAMLSQADRALYQAKAGGRNQVGIAANAAVGSVDG